MGTVFYSTKHRKQTHTLNGSKYKLAMAAVLLFLVGQLFLFGTTSAQCPEPCTPCKEFSGGDYNGTWNLKAVIDPLCPGRCLYQRNSDGKEMCFCDPGSIEYTPCPEWQGGLCYNDTAQPKLYSHWEELVDNSVENCRTYCINQNDDYTYFGLESSNQDDGIFCYCGNIEPPTETHPVVDPSNCWVGCPGNDDQTCGAFNFINVWAVVPYTPVVTTPASGRR